MVKKQQLKLKTSKGIVIKLSYLTISVHFYYAQFNFYPSNSISLKQD